VHFVVIVAQCSHNLLQTENLHHVFFNLDEISSETYEMLTKAFVMKISVEHNPMDCVLLCQKWPNVSWDYWMFRLFDV